MNYISFHSVGCLTDLKKKILVGRNKMNAKLKYMPILISADFKKNSDSSLLRCHDQ